MTDIDIRAVRKTYGKVETLHGVDLAIKTGEFVVILGPSGCGKSTLLRMIAGLEEITSGEIAIGGKVVNKLEPRERGCAMVFQNYALYPHMTVAGNIGYALKVAGVPKAERMERVRKVAASVGLEALLDRKPAQLSGGQRQRVAIARAFAPNPALLVADEPVSALDVSVQAQVLNLLQDLREQHGIAYLFISHDLAVVNQVCDEVLVLHRGRVVERGAPAQLFAAPQHPYTQALVGAVPRIAPGAARARRAAAAQRV